MPTAYHTNYNPAVRRSVLVVDDELINREMLGMLLDGENEVRLLRPGHYRILNQPPAHYLGLIALDETVEGLTLKGVKYPLERFTLHRGNTRTVSNEILPGEAAELSFQRGSLYVIRSGFCDTQPADRRLKV